LPIIANFLLGGDIYIWDRETAMLLHYIPALQVMAGDNSGNLTAMGWNHSSPGKFMFSSATHDGTVCVWTAPAPPEQRYMNLF
jgi:WD repeat-containing protein 26